MKHHHTNPPLIQSTKGVTLVGGGPISARQLGTALALAPTLVAADGGADRALAAGHAPQLVIGDFDSISASARHRLADRLHHVAEQETTDFDKALRNVAAPFVLAVGFAGARMDHALAVMNTLVRHADRRCIVLSGRDICFLAPPVITLDLPRRSRLSLFPMGPVRGQSQGLRWPLDGATFAPDGMIGTSNETAAPDVQLTFDAPKMLVILPRAALSRAIASLAAAPSWDAGRSDAPGR